MVSNVGQPMKATADKNIKVSVTLTPQVYEKLYEQKELTGLSMGRLICEALLEQWKKG